MYLILLSVERRKTEVIQRHRLLADTAHCCVHGGAGRTSAPGIRQEDISEEIGLTNLETRSFI